MKRSQWKLGRIEELVVGTDNVVRGAIVRTCTEGKRGRISRPLEKLCPLEIRGTVEKDVAEQEVDDNSDDDNDVATEEDSSSARPRRKAAIEGEDRRRRIENELAGENVV